MALLIVPSLVVPLLFGQEPTGVAVALARVTGIALLALGFACWPGPPLVGLLTYNAVVAVYLAYLGFAGGLTGVLLWPAVVLHVILTALLTWVAMRTLPPPRDPKRSTERPGDPPPVTRVQALPSLSAQ